MYIESLAARWFRCFDVLEVTDLVHPADGRALRIPNVNVLLGDNGSGKSASMKAIALSVLGPMLGSSGYVSSNDVRRGPDSAAIGSGESEIDSGEVEATIVSHGLGPEGGLLLRLEIDRFGDAEVVTATTDVELVRPILFSNADPRMFLAGYGTRRQSASAGSFDPNVRNKQYLERIQRVGSLLLPEFSLVPLASWLPKSPRVKELIEILGSLSSHVDFLPKVERDELMVRYRGAALPWSALSDGYRSFFDWVGDLLFRLESADPTTSLTDMRGVVLIDELDLHLHPRWQSEVVQALSRTFPCLQFIITTHSPLVVGSLDAENIIILEQDDEGVSRSRRPNSSPWGLSAEQLLLSSEFGFDLDTARDKTFEQKLDGQRRKAATGNIDAAIELQRMLALGNEGSAAE